MPLSSMTTEDSLLSAVADNSHCRLRCHLVNEIGQSALIDALGVRRVTPRTSSPPTWENQDR